ncbi:MAG: MBOAT family O-acyltransferase [Verrucomicrobiales bacterium]
MVFSSQIFIFYFLPLSLLLYYAAPRLGRHLVLTLVSYVFYGWWNPWFTLLMLGSTTLDYFCGKWITLPGSTQDQRRTALILSIAANLSILAFFKYSGFAVGAAGDVAQGLGFAPPSAPEWVRRVVLPVGVSFYTFQSMSYCIDLYRGHARPAASFIDFACYVSMYPQLVAGPIVRYRSIAEQLRYREHTPAGFVMGISRFCFGFAKKIFLANPMGPIADACFGAGDGILVPGAAWLGAAAFAFQIYFDFSAYSDMAIGLGRMFGFHFIENFNAPYRSSSFSEFWRRWHISLSTWLRDYLYIPLGGNRKGPGRTYVNLLTVMVLGGLWHGAQWTFVIWGAIHGLMLSFERVLGRQSLFARLPAPIRVGLTFAILLVTWVFFRAENMEVATRYVAAMFGRGGEAATQSLLLAEITTPYALFSLALCGGVAWLAPTTHRLLEKLSWWKVTLGLFLFILSLGEMSRQGFNPFLYFQF